MTPRRFAGHVVAGALAAFVGFLAGAALRVALGLSPHAFLVHVVVGSLVGFAIGVALRLAVESILHAVRRARRGGAS